MHLESQINVSTAYISSRDQPTQVTHSSLVTDQLATILSTLNLLITKLSAVADHQASKSSAVNVYNSQCRHHKPDMVAQSSQTTECFTTNPAHTAAMVMNTGSNYSIEPGPVITEAENVLTCTLCGHTMESNEELEAHIESTHGRDKTSAYKCDNCNRAFSSQKHLDLHISEKHKVDYIQCCYCKLRVQNRSQLDQHMKESHVMSIETSAPSSTATSAEPSSMLESSSQRSSSSPSPNL